jgi:hypothetical protein
MPSSQSREIYVGSIVGQPPQPYHIEVVLPCADGTLDLSNLLLRAELGLATGLLIGSL